MKSSEITKVERVCTGARTRRARRQGREAAGAAQRHLSDDVTVAAMPTADRTTLILPRLAMRSVPHDGDVVFSTDATLQPAIAIGPSKQKVFRQLWGAREG